MTSFGTRPRPLWEVAEKPHHGMTWEQFHAQEGKTGKLPISADAKLAAQEAIRNACRGTKRRILNAIGTKRLTAAEISERTGISIHTVRDNLTRMKKEGVLNKGYKEGNSVKWFAVGRK